MGNKIHSLEFDPMTGKVGKRPVNMSIFGPVVNTSFNRSTLANTG